jgi:hypothetical protein
MASNNIREGKRKGIVALEENADCSRLLNQALGGAIEVYEAGAREGPRQVDKKIMRYPECRVSEVLQLIVCLGSRHNRVVSPTAEGNVDWCNYWRHFVGMPCLMTEVG